MDKHQSDLLERAVGLPAAKALIDRATDELLAEAVLSTANLSALATVLGIHRSTIYRRVPKDRIPNDGGPAEVSS